MGFPSVAILLSPHTGLVRPSGLEPQKNLKKESRKSSGFQHWIPQRPKECIPESEKSLNSDVQPLFGLLRDLWRTFSGLWGPVAGGPWTTHSGFFLDSFGVPERRRASEG